MARSSSDNRKTGSTELAQLIRVRRKHLGLSRQELADATGIPYPTIAQIETAYRGVSPARLGVIARVLGLDPKDVYDLLASAPASSGAGPAADEEWQPQPATWIANPSYRAPAEALPAAPPPLPDGADPASGAAGRPVPTPHPAGTPTRRTPTRRTPTRRTPTNETAARGWLPRARAIPTPVPTTPTPTPHPRPAVTADPAAPPEPTRDQPGEVAAAIARLLQQLSLAERVELLNDLQRQLMLELLQRQPPD